MQISKDTRFRDLPEHIKKKLIDLHNKSIPSITVHDVENIENYSSLLIKINSLPVQNLKQNIFEIANYIESIKKRQNKNFIDLDEIEKNIQCKIKELEIEISLYSDCLNQSEFLDELKEIYMVLSGRIENIRNENLKNSNLGFFN